MQTKSATSLLTFSVRLHNSLVQEVNRFSLFIVVPLRRGKRFGGKIVGHQEKEKDTHHHHHGPAPRSRNHPPNTIDDIPIILSFFSIIGSNCGSILRYDDDDDESKLLLSTQSPIAISRSWTTTILQRSQLLPIIEVFIFIFS